MIDAIARADFRPQRRLAPMARNQLGTVGAGNRYVDLFAGDDGFVWIGVHFGSRATMGEPSVILRGRASEDGEALPYSTVHGAGRVMSRTKAAGRMGNRAGCSERGCTFWVSWAHYRHEREHAGVGGHERFTLRQLHPRGRMVKRRARIKEGEIVHRLTPIGVAMAGADMFDPYKD